MARGQRWALPCILGLALALRACGIGFGLDRRDPEQTLLCLKDERGMANEVREALESGSPHPGTFLLRGPGTFLLFSAVDAALVGLQAASHPKGWKGVLAGLKQNPSDLHLSHRWLGLLAGVATVFLVWRLVRREFDGRSALCAALVLATAYVHVRESHFGQTDVLWAFVTLLALDRAWLLIRAPSPRRYAVAGLLAGLAAAVKYFSALLGAHLLVAHLLARAEARREQRAEPPHSRLILAWALLPAGFLLVFPGLFVAWRDFVDRILFSVDVYGASPAPSDLAQGFLIQVRDTLGIGLGEPVFLLALAGLPLCWRRGASGRFGVLSALLILPSILLTEHHPARFGLALLVALVIPAGIAFAALLARVPRPAALVLVPLVVAPSLVRSVFFDRLMRAQDTRVEMLVALNALDAPSDDVFAIGWHHGLPAPINRNLKPYRRDWPETPDEFAALLAELRADPPPYVLRDYTMQSSKKLTEIEDALGENYRELLRLDGRRPGDATVLPDPRGGNPDLMVPFANPWAMTRPGPPLALFARVAE